MEKTCDILVVGGGGAGLVAAARAAQVGAKKVIVLEKAKNTGGGMQFARTQRIFGSKWQKDRGLPDVTASYLREVMDATWWRLDPGLALNTVKATGEFFDWFCELAEPEEVALFHEGKYMQERYDGPIGPQLDEPGNPVACGRVYMNVMYRKCNEFGVEILTSHRAVRSKVKDGKIVAVEAEGPEGRVLIHCGTCILACGSWVNNHEVTKKYYPGFYDAQIHHHVDVCPHTNPNYTGDGFNLIRGLDVDEDEKNLALRLMGPMVFTHNRVIGSMCNSPFAITVNQNARRFVCEPSQVRMQMNASGIVQMDQPEGAVYILFNSDTLGAAVRYRKVHPSEKKGPFEASDLPETLEEAETELQEYMNRKKESKKFFIADSIEMLAKEIEMDPAALRDQIRIYNNSCRRGFDEQCFKDASYLVPFEKGPYYAVKTILSTDGAFGGALVNKDMQALHRDGSPVQDLYVAGDFASGRFINMAGVKEQLINDMSWALASGFIAGTNAGNAE